MIDEWWVVPQHVVSVAVADVRAAGGVGAHEVHLPHSRTIARNVADSVDMNAAVVEEELVRVSCGLVAEQREYVAAVYDTIPRRLCPSQCQHRGQHVKLAR